MTKPRQWPVPGDTPLDQARTIARGYREALRHVAPELCAKLDAQAHNLGQQWIAPLRETIDLDAMFTARDLAAYLGSPHTVDQIRQWASRGQITRHRSDDGRTVYRLGDALDHIAGQRRRRAHRT